MKRSKDQHFAALLETTRAVSPIMHDCAYSGLTARLGAAITPSMERCLSRRKDGPLLRPFLTRLCYEATGGAFWRQHMSILTAVELFNISTYQSNYSFDEKSGTHTASDRNNQFICSMLTINRAMTLVASCASLNDVAKLRILSLMAGSNDEVYQGQFYDLNLLNLDRISDFPQLDVFIPAYATRCNLIAGSTFRACAAGALINDPPSDSLGALINLLGALGAAAQAINDLGDFIPHLTKDYAVPYSDFQLGRLTLPIFLLHEAGLPLPEWRESLRADHAVPHVEKMLTDAILDLKIEMRVRQFVKSQFFPTIRSSLAALETVVGQERAAPFWFAYPFIFESRLLRYFRSDRSRAWPQ